MNTGCNKKLYTNVRNMRNSYYTLVFHANLYSHSSELGWLPEILRIISTKKMSYFVGKFKYV